MIDWLVALVWKGMIAGGFDAPHVIASVLGAIVAALMDDNGGWFQRVAGAFSGALCSIYFAPAVSIALGVSGVALANAVAFFVGLVGMYVTKGLLKKAKAYAHRPGALKDAFRELVLRLIAKK